MSQALDIEGIRELNRSRTPGLPQDHERVRAALARLGDPSPADQAAMGLQGLDDPDRNVRVQMVRLLGALPRELAAPGMLRALGDPVRRVRRQAAKLCAPLVADVAIAARLGEITEDEREVAKIRSAAFLALSSGQTLSKLSESPEALRELFRDVPELARSRRVALEVLVGLDPLPDAARAVLRDLTETGTREEAVWATRALCGFKVVNLAALPEHERRQVTQTCEPARDRVLYWVPRTAP